MRKLQLCCVWPEIDKTVGARPGVVFAHDGYSFEIGDCRLVVFLLDVLMTYSVRRALAVASKPNRQIQIFLSFNSYSALHIQVSLR